jgi:Protein of unknown function (DUF2458)
MDQKTPDLATVLATLAAYAPPKFPPNTTHTKDGDDDVYEPPDILPQQWSTQLPSQNPSQTSTNTLRAGNAPREAPKTLSIDPKTIITWPAGLKCVMKTVARNEAILAQVRKVNSTMYRVRVLGDTKYFLADEGAARSRDPMVRIAILQWSSFPILNDVGFEVARNY